MIPPDISEEIARADPEKRARIAALLAKPRQALDPDRACPRCHGITYLVSMDSGRRHCRHCQRGFQPA